MGEFGDGAMSGGGILHLVEDRAAADALKALESWVAVAGVSGSGSYVGGELLALIGEVGNGLVSGSGILRAVEACAVAGVLKDLGSRVAVAAAPGPGVIVGGELQLPVGEFGAGRCLAVAFCAPSRLALSPVRSRASVPGSPLWTCSGPGVIVGGELPLSVVKFGDGSVSCGGVLRPVEARAVAGALPALGSEVAAAGVSVLGGGSVPRRARVA
ncbi:hypothetical protein [Kitasatospora sp. CB02891]|uniref:hypothetical protein n=1 Tax=Kitasatospora sp. CB02891 TaxID=2020329 RepID=UPI0012FD408D|nr:hypothetical protein [Kitasatospora sp. CB02891]